MLTLSRRHAHSLPTAVDELDRMFHGFFGNGHSNWLPALDVVETADAVTVKAEVPGIDPKEIEIALDGDVLEIRGEKLEEQRNEEALAYRYERRHGSFSRRVTLRSPVDAGKIEAVAKNGVLTITLPKAEEARPRRIQIKTK